MYVDPSAASFKQELRRLGVHPPIKDANNDVLDGIRELISLFGNGDIKIHTSCRNLIAEMQSYCWDSKLSEKGEDVPIKRFDHAIDSLRYGVFSYFKDRLSLKEPTLEQLGGRTLGFNRNNGYEPSPYMGMYLTDIGQREGSFVKLKESSVF